MKINRKSACFIIAIGAYFSDGLNAQNFYGLQNSNFNGVNAIYLNPAGIADARFRQHANIFGFGVNASNNFATFEPPFSFMDLVKKNPNVPRDSAGHIQWNPSWVKQNLDGNPKNLFFGMELRGPAAMTRLGDRAAVAVGTRTRTSFQLTNVSEDFAKYVKSFMDSSGQSFANIKNNSFSLQANAYQEFSISGALVLWNKKAFYLKAGATAKYLMGIGSAYIMNNGIDISSKSKDTIVFNNSDVAVGYSNPDFINRLKNGTFAASLPTLKNISGGGYGFDFGAIFEWRPEATDILTSNNKYLLKGGVSLLDWGKITYRNKIQTYTANNSTPVVFTEDSAFSAAFSKGTDSGLAWVQNYAKAHFNYQSGPGQYSSSIPTTLNVQLDWNVIKFLYVGLNWTQSVVSKKDIGFRRPSSVVVIPRFETKLLEVAFPLSMYNNYTVFGMGAFLRVGQVFIGTDNLLKSIDNKSFNGFDFYFGVSTGLGAHKMKKKN